jgi:hypothetical protein
VEGLLEKYELPLNKLACFVTNSSSETEAKNGVLGNGVKNVALKIHSSHFIVHQDLGLMCGKT